MEGPRKGSPRLYGSSDLKEGRKQKAFGMEGRENRGFKSELCPMFPEKQGQESRMKQARGECRAEASRQGGWGTGGETIGLRGLLE